jgi:4-hydroxy-3-methylbut-2-en-1-yl diphosphate reductase
MAITNTPAHTAMSAAGRSTAAVGHSEDPISLGVSDAVVPEEVRPRLVLLASPRSLCAGVERAIETVERLLDQRAETGGTVYVRKQIVHNTHVIADLERLGAVFVDELRQIPDPAPAGSVVVFSAHGVCPAVWAEAAERGLDVVDATCPLVIKVHAEARRFASRANTVVLIGHAGHEEVEGTLGQAPEHTVLVQSAEEVNDLNLPDAGRVAYLTQTTLAVEETAEVIDALKVRFPAAQGPGSEDICYATTNRQQALAQVAERAQAVLVVGSANSSNSVRLVEVAERHGARAYLIDDASDIDPDWLQGAEVVGLTAGASAPQHLVDQVIDHLKTFGPVEVREYTVTTETVQFMLPKQARPPKTSGVDVSSRGGRPYDLPAHRGRSRLLAEDA